MNSGSYAVSDTSPFASTVAVTFRAPYAVSNTPPFARTIAITFRAPYAVSDNASIARTVAVALRAPEPSSIELTHTFALKCAHSSTLRLPNTSAVARTEPCTNLAANTITNIGSFTSAYTCPHLGSKCTRCRVRRSIVQNDDADRPR